MTVLSKLSSSLNRKDEGPNEELAQEIVERKDKKAIGELIENLNNKNKKIQRDCIKVLYEVGEKESELIKEYADVFINLLSTKNNRLLWGAMTAIDSITANIPAKVYKHLPEIIKASDAGSVIAKDHAVSILAKLSGIPKYANDTTPLLIEQIRRCPVNQMPMYAEAALGVITKPHVTLLSVALLERLSEIDKESRHKRIMKVMKKLGNI